MHVGGPGCQDSDCCLAERKPNRLRKTRTAYLSTGVRSYNRNGIAALKVWGEDYPFAPPGLTQLSLLTQCLRRGLHSYAASRLRAGTLPDRIFEDRKSTRLNSSHLGI